ETLAALRKAGYAPVAEEADGATVLEQVVRRAPVPVPRPRPVDEPTEEVGRRVLTGDEARELAQALLDRPDGTMRASLFPPDGFDDPAEAAAYDALLQSFFDDEPDDDDLLGPERDRWR